VRELDSRNGALRSNEFGDTRERGYVFVFPNAEVGERDATPRLDGASFGKDKGGASDSAAAQVDEMPVVGKSILAGVLAHWRDNDAMPKFDVANSQR
jgi:hypothetical protein